LVLASACFGGGPVSERDLSEVKQIETPKKVEVEFAYDGMSKIDRHLTLGLGLGGNPMVGYVEKDGFGYPRDEFGFTWCLGFGYTWFSGQPTEKQIRQALDSIRGKQGTFVNEKDIPSLVRQETGIESLDYFEIGSWALLLPVNIEKGKMWILNDNTRARLGFGLPTLVSFGINFDF